jgi:hypothetical protein
VSLSSPHLVQERLEKIDGQLAIALNGMEDCALAWYRLKRDREVEEAETYAISGGPATERKVLADAAGAQIGVEEEARWEVRKLTVRVLETQANIGMAILKAQGRS